MSKTDTFASADMKGQIERVPKVSGDKKNKTSVKPRDKTTVRYHVTFASYAVCRFGC